MKTYLKNFSYDKNGEITERSVYIIFEDDTSIEGFDFRRLTEEEQASVKEIFDGRELLVQHSKKENSDSKDSSLKEILGKSYRRFKKTNIIEVEIGRAHV